MARLSIESQAAPAAQGPMQRQLDQVSTLLAVLCAGVAVAAPGVFLGGMLAGMTWWLHRPRTWARVTIAILVATPVVALRSFIAWGWAWRPLLDHELGRAVSIDSAAVARSLLTEALAGPLWFECVLLSVLLWSRRVHVQVARDHRRDQRRWRALTNQRQFSVPSPRIPAADLTSTHPDGCIRLGLDNETRRPLDLELPELAQHVFLPGASGSGKTTTLTRLADGALANGYGVVIVDCKGGDLGGVAGRLAATHGVPFHIVDPDDPDTLGYNPCSGDAASVANKLVGAFTFSPAAEIYKNIGMESIPVVVRGLQAAGERVTLEAVYEAFGTRGMERLAHRVEDERIRDRLLNLGDRDGDRAGKAGHSGLQHRLGALLEGKFGDLFRATAERSLDWDRALSEPAVTYVALSTMASSEDVELMGRVIAQDLKQVCARRLRALGRGERLLPALAIFDEFAALREAEQIVDLLLQARQALMPTVISVQYIPESVPVRKSVLGAGLIVAHRVEGEDAEAVATQFGTRRANEPTHQVNYETGESQMGSIRRVEKFNVHPNELRNFRPGQAAVRSVARQRYSIVQVHRETT